MAFDYKKEYKEFYMPKNKPSIVEVPKMNYIAVRGKGNPNEENGDYIIECKECYSNNNRITPLLGARECLENHLQYVCGTCGRCICIDKDKIRSLQRWNFPFRSLDIAKLYLRTADYTNKKCCGIYEIENSKGRKSYKIFTSDTNLKEYLSKNKDKICKENKVMFSMNEYKEYPNTKIKHLSQKEVEKYLSEM